MVVSVAEGLRLGVQDDMGEYFRGRGRTELVYERMFTREIKTDKRKVMESFKESIPFPDLWAYGETRTHSDFKDRFIEFVHQNWNLTIDHSRWDEADEVIKGDIKVHLNALVGRFIQLEQQLWLDTVLVQASLGQPSTLAWDGAAITANQDGDGNARFGVAGGNKIITPLSTVADCFDALTKGKLRFRQMKDTAGQPFWQGSEIGYKNMVIMCAPEKETVWLNLLNAKFAGIDQSLPMATTNIMAEGDTEPDAGGDGGSGTSRPKLWVNERWKSSTQTILLINHPYHKPVAGIDRQVEPEVVYADHNNSEAGRERGVNSMAALVRRGTGVFSPHTIMMLTAA